MYSAHIIRQYRKPQVYTADPKNYTLEPNIERT